MSSDSFWTFVFVLILMVVALVVSYAVVWYLPYVFLFFKWLWFDVVCKMIEAQYEHWASLGFNISSLVLPSNLTVQ